MSAIRCVETDEQGSWLRVTRGELRLFAVCVAPTRWRWRVVHTCGWRRFLPARTRSGNLHEMAEAHYQFVHGRPSQ